MRKLELIKLSLFKILGNRVKYLKDKFIEDWLGHVENFYPQGFKKDSTEKQHEIKEAKEVFKLLLQADPTVNKQYLSWLITQYWTVSTQSYLEEADVSVFLEDLPKISRYLATFYELGLKKKLKGDEKDIFKYDVAWSYLLQEYIDNEPMRELRPPEGKEDLYEKVKPYLYSEGALLTNAEVEILSKDATKMWDGERWEVWVPRTERASQILGKSTEWCTAYGYEGGNYPSRMCLFSQYGTLYVIINKAKPEERYQLDFISGQSMDEDDRPIILNELLGHEPELQQALNKNLETIKSDWSESVIWKIFNDVWNSEYDDITWKYEDITNVLHRVVNEMGKPTSDSKMASYFTYIIQNYGDELLNLEWRSDEDVVNSAFEKAQQYMNNYLQGVSSIIDFSKFARDFLSDEQFNIQELAYDTETKGYRKVLREWLTSFIRSEFPELLLQETQVEQSIPVESTVPEVKSILKRILECQKNTNLKKRNLVAEPVHSGTFSCTLK